MRWIVTLYGNQRDVEWLAVEFSDISEVEGEPFEVHLELDDPEGDAPEEHALSVGRAVIEAHVRRINGFGRLRWGRMFEGVEITDFKTIDSEGEITTIHFLERDPEYMLPEDCVERANERGIPRARLPVGMEALSILDGESVATLAATNRTVALVLRLVDEMVAGDEEIDWGAGYSALEVIEQDLHNRGLKGRPSDGGPVPSATGSRPRRTAWKCLATTLVTASRLV